MFREKYNSITIVDELLNTSLFNPFLSQQLLEILQGNLIDIYYNRKTPQIKQNFAPSVQFSYSVMSKSSQPHRL